MKWIGQHIYDLIARFRHDVYLEDIADGTVVDDKFLGLDSNNKIVKETITSSSGDITGVTITTDSGGGSKAEDTGGSADFSILGTSGVGVTNSGATITVTSVPGEIDHNTLLNFSDGKHFTQEEIDTVGSITTGIWRGSVIESAYLDADTAHLSGTQTFSGAKTFTATATNFTSATADSPVVRILNTTDDDQAGRLILEKLRADDGVASLQNLGEIWFRGQDNAQNTEDYAAVIGEIDVSTGGQESGKLSLYVASHDGGNNRGLEIVGGSVDNEVDVTVGAGANSLTTIAGDLSVTTGLILDSVDVTTIQTSGESFADNDTSLMTSAAIDDRINAAGGGSLSGDNFATDLKIGRDADNLIDFTTDNRITFRVSAEDNVVMKPDGGIDASELSISGAIAMTSDKKLSFGHASTFIEGMTSGSKLGLYGQTDILLRINNSSVIVMDNAKCEFSIPAIPATNDGVALGSATKMWSDVYCAGNIELGHASDTTIARSAAGVATIESNIIQTRNKVIHLEQGTLSDNIAADEHFFPAVTTAESEAFANVVTPLLMPVGGKLLKIHLKSNNDLNGSSNEITFRLYAAGTDDRWNEGDKSLLGTKVITGGVKRDVMVADFQDLTTTGASGTNAFSASDMIGISIQNSQAQGTTHKFVWTFVFELDFNSY